MVHNSTCNGVVCVRWEFVHLRLSSIKERCDAEVEAWSVAATAYEADRVRAEVTLPLLVSRHALSPHGFLELEGWRGRQQSGEDTMCLVRGLRFLTYLRGVLSLFLPVITRTSGISITYPLRWIKVHWPAIQILQQKWCSEWTMTMLRCVTQLAMFRTGARFIPSRMREQPVVPSMS